MNERDALARKLQLLEWERIRRNPVYWFENYAWSVDEHRRIDNERKLFHGKPFIDPATMEPCRELDGSDDDYLLYVTAMWWNNDLLAVPKSRQLRLTHLMVNLHGWLGMCWPGQRIAIQSKKEDDADATLKRLKESFRIMHKQHPWVPWPDLRYKHTRITFPNGSIMMAVQQGAAAVRQYTFSAIFSDEMAFQMDADEAYTAAIPTIEGGGKYSAISTAEVSFFQKLVYDKTDVA